MVTGIFSSSTSRLFTIITMNVLLRITLAALLLIQIVAANEVSNNGESKIGISPAEFVQLGDKNYYFGPAAVQVDFLEAMKLCIDFQMKLVSLETAEEWTLVNDYIFNKGDINVPFWSSGRQILDSWQWSSSGRVFSFTAWMDHHPNLNVDEEVCVAFRTREGWEDLRCTDKTCSYVCEQL